MSASRTLFTGEAAASVGHVLDLLLQDCSLRPVDAGTLPWDRPVLVLRSADMGRMQARLDEIVRHNPAPALHILSHARDAEAMARMAPCPFTFHGYPVPGRYRLEELPADLLGRVRAADFGMLLFLDTGLREDFFQEVERLLTAIAPDRMVGFLDDGTFAKAPPADVRALAEPAFFRLVEWYQRLTSS